MQKNISYLNTPELSQLAKYLADKVPTKNGQVKLRINDPALLRADLFQCFQTSDFLSLYYQATKSIITKLNLEVSEYVVQTTPTPRIFLPGAHGTSFHSDYWYGHGKESYTVWLAITSAFKGNSFQYYPDARESIFTSSLEKGILPTRSDLLSCSIEKWVEPNIGEAFIFPATLIHGSPLNDTESTRVSIDFRISKRSDETSTKDLANYYYFNKDDFSLHDHLFKGRRVLRYIVGGRNKNTFIQHAIIEACSKRYGFTAIEQEAEIERFGFPVLSEILKESKKVEATRNIILASSSLLDSETIKLAKNSHIDVWCALENKLLAS
jgi:hypothetical protein